MEGLVAVSLIAGCKAEKPSIVGEYEGTYSRTSHHQVNDLVISFEQGKVYFKFTGKTYSCSGEQEYLPPSGHGEYKVVDNKLILTDKAYRTANFDWTLVLNGEFDCTHKEGTLKLQQYNEKTNRYHKIVLEKK